MSTAHCKTSERPRWLGGLRDLPASQSAKRARKGATKRDPSAAPGDRVSARGRRIRYEETPFEAGSASHSRFVAGVVQANTLHPDHQQAARSLDTRLVYAALMIGKESIAFNDRTGTAGDYLEKLLDFYFKLNARRPQRVRRRGSAATEQERLDLDKTP